MDWGISNGDVIYDSHAQIPSKDIVQSPGLAARVLELDVIFPACLLKRRKISEDDPFKVK